MSPLTAYLLGGTVIVLGLAVAAYLLDVPLVVIAIGVVAALAVGALLLAKGGRPTGS